MASFVSKAACRGYRPARFSAARLQRRPAVVSRLLRERSVARFLIAPDGFGKTCAALEYAQTIFEFEHVFWIPCESPCFVRDLDANSLVRDILSCDNQPKLVVFDAVPALDFERASQFSLVIDSLIDIDCEVLVCCAPSADVYSSLQRDRLRLGARDLLLSDSELANATDVSGAPFGPRAKGDLSPNRIAAIGWPSGDDAQVRFLRGLAIEDLPLGIVLTMLGMFVLRQGSLDDLSAFVSVSDESLTLLEQDYPHFGIDRVSGGFSTVEFPVVDLAAAYRSKIEAAASCSVFADRDSLGLCWAETLFKNGNPSRACDTARRFCSQRPRGHWILDHDEALLDSTCILPSLDVLDSLGDAPPRAAEVALAKARRYSVLSDGLKAASTANRLAFNLAASPFMRMQALMVVAKNADQAQAAQAEESIIELLIEKGFLEDQRVRANDDSDDPRKPPASIVYFDAAFGRWAARSEPFAEADRFWAPLGIVLVSLRKGSVSAAAAWSEMQARKADPRALSEGAAWILRQAIDERNGSGRDLLGYDALEAIELYVCMRMSKEASNQTFADVLAALALEHVRSRGLHLSREPLAAGVLLRLHEVEMDVYKQRSAYQQRRRDEESRRVDRFATRPDSYLDAIGPAEQPQSAPLLDVRLFGGMEVYLGAERIDVARIKRNKVKTLLAILVLARGRDVSRDLIVQSLWPDSDIEAARRNFYTIWSSLRNALELPDGTCPYLIRRRGGCAIDTHLVRSDIKRFDAVCRKLQFGALPLEDADDLYRQIDEEFTAELLPAEEQNPIIRSAREECRSQLVDALVGGAGRLMNTGEARQSLWLARSALRLDPLREDSYAVLMMAQSALGQRTAAIMTFFKCKRMLSEQLGLDPSPQVKSIYEALIDPLGGQDVERA